MFEEAQKTARNTKYSKNAKFDVNYDLLKPDSAQQVEGDVYIGDSTLNFYNTKKTDRSASLSVINRQTSANKGPTFMPSPGSIILGSKRSLKLLMEDLLPGAGNSFAGRH
jgi:hypothetical protein